MATDITTLLTATGGAFLGKFVGPAAEHLGKAAWEGAQRLGASAHQLLANVGREPQPVEPKVLIPLVQAAALESDAGLAEKWAALLANAADPAQQVPVQAGFIEVLRQLTPLDALAIEAMHSPNGVGPARAIHTSVMPKQLVSRLAVSYDEVCLSVDNLLRLRLCMDSDNAKRGPFSGPPSTPGNLSSTVFGLAFLQACLPPESIPIV